MFTVTILNPGPDGRRYTSARKAQQYIARGRAVMDGDSLRFITRASHSHKQDSAAENAYYWNGADRNPWALHRPGEVRS